MLLFLATLSSGKFFEFSVYFPSKLKFQVFVLLFLATLSISPSILPLWELHALSLYKPLQLVLSTLPALDPENDDGYDTEVRLVQGATGFSSSGFVEIYLHDTWSPVCNMGARDADSACRQLGYTNTAAFGSDDS